MTAMSAAVPRHDEGVQIGPLRQPPTRTGGPAGALIVLSGEGSAVRRPEHTTDENLDTSGEREFAERNLEADPHAALEVRRQRVPALLAAFTLCRH